MADIELPQLGESVTEGTITRWFKAIGDQVAEGQVLGYEGDTGWSTGCHIHFTVMANGQAVDPMSWF